MNKHDQICAIVALAQKFHLESDGALPFDAAYFSKKVEAFLQHDKKCVLIFKRHGKIKGFLLGLVTPYPAAPVLQAHEYLWYCAPEHRARGALALFGQYEAWAVEQGASLIFAGAYQDGAGPYYKRKGFKKIETCWVKAV